MEVAEGQHLYRELTLTTVTCIVNFQITAVPLLCTSYVCVGSLSAESNSSGCGTVLGQWCSRFGRSQGLSYFERKCCHLVSGWLKACSKVLCRLANDQVSVCYVRSRPGKPSGRTEVKTSIHSYSLDCLSLHVEAVLQSISVCTHTSVLFGILD